jgi:hypothetical protein
MSLSFMSTSNTVLYISQRRRKGLGSFASRFDHA